MDHPLKIDITIDTVLPALQGLLGSEMGMHVGELVEHITDEDSTPQAERNLRTVITALRMEGYPACATPDDDRARIN